MKYNVRPAQLQDLPRLDEIYAGARRFMAENGNPTQWGTTNPPRERLIQDIHEGKLYVITEADQIHGVFFFALGEDPTYVKIYDGNWSSNDLYGTIHRIAGDGSGGILRTAVDFAGKQTSYIRIDTHENNTVMHSALKKYGFRRCGTIFLESGSERIAYDFKVSK